MYKHETKPAPFCPYFIQFNVSDNVICAEAFQTNASNFIQKNIINSSFIYQHLIPMVSIPQGIQHI